MANRNAGSRLVVWNTAAAEHIRGLTDNQLAIPANRDLLHTVKVAGVGYVTYFGSVLHKVNELWREAK